MGVTFANKPCYDPRAAARTCIKQGLPTDPWLGLVNGYTCPLGFSSGSGHVLMARQDLDALDLNSPGSLVFGDGQNTLTLASLSILRANCVVPSNEGNPLSLYHVELVDARHWFALTSIDQAFNIRENLTGPYLQLTVFGENPYTWDEMVGTIWNLIGGGIGAYPGLPFTPDGTPEGFAFWGGIAWSALENVLTRLSCTVKYDPVTTVFSIVRKGFSDSSLQDALDRYQSVKHQQEDPQIPLKPWKASTLRVLFKKSPEPLDGGSIYYHLDRTDQDKSVLPGSVAQVFDDLVAHMPSTQTSSLQPPENLSLLESRADDRADDYFRVAGANTDQDRQVLAATAPDSGLRPGVLVTVARWCDRGAGLVTEIVRTEDESLLGWMPPAVSILTPTQCFAQLGSNDLAGNYNWTQVDWNGFEWASVTGGLSGTTGDEPARQWNSGTENISGTICWVQQTLDSLRWMFQPLATYTNSGLMSTLAQSFQGTKSFDVIGHHSIEVAPAQPTWIYEWNHSIFGTTADAYGGAYMVWSPVAGGGELTSTIIFNQAPPPGSGFSTSNPLAHIMAGYVGGFFGLRTMATLCSSPNPGFWGSGLVPCWFHIASVGGSGISGGGPADDTLGFYYITPNLSEYQINFANIQVNHITAASAQLTVANVGSINSGLYEFGNVTGISANVSGLSFAGGLYTGGSVTSGGITVGTTTIIGGIVNGLIAAGAGGVATSVSSLFTGRRGKYV